MKPSRELRNYYRKIITDFLYTDMTNWRYYGYDLYCFCYSTDKLKITIYEKNIENLMYLFKNIEVKINDDDDDEFLMSSNLNINILTRKLKKYHKEKEQKNFEQKCYDAIPLTSKRKLKIEQIYKK